MEEYFSIGSRTLVRVSLAVLLLNDLTGKPITGSNARAWIDSARAPIKKNDGWFIFTDLAPGDYLVQAEGGTFQLTQRQCHADAEGMETVILRLKPGRCYPVPPHFLRVEGKAEPGADVTIVHIRRGTSYKLLADALRGSRTIHVFHPEGIHLEGRTFQLTNGNGTPEDILLISSVGGGEYRLSQPLEQDCPRIGSQLLPVTDAKADEKGEFFAVLKDVTAASKLIVQAKGGRTVTKEYEQPDLICFRPDLRQHHLKV